MNGDKISLINDGHVSCEPVEYAKVPNFRDPNCLTIDVVILGMKLLTLLGIVLLTSNVNGLLFGKGYICFSICKASARAGRIVIVPPTDAPSSRDRTSNVD